MPAKKPVHLHKLHGTYQPCRHGERESRAKARGSHKRTVPVWLPDEVKAIYRKLMVCLPPLDTVEETTLSQLAVLKHQFEQDPDSFSASLHSQLRHLSSVVREWVKDYRDTEQQQEEDKSDFEHWCDDREKRKAVSNNLMPEKEQQPIKTNQNFVGPVRRPRAMPLDLPVLRVSR